MIMPGRVNPRAAFRQSQERRMARAATLAEKFPKLKALKVEAEFYAAGNETRIGQIKYMPNLEFASSILCIECPNRACVRGDFDLSTVLAEAFATHRKSVSGEMPCRGWRDQDSIKKATCRITLHYKLSLKY
jgi:hypothetical protein